MKVKVHVFWLGHFAKSKIESESSFPIKYYIIPIPNFFGAYIQRRQKMDFPLLAGGGNYEMLFWLSVALMLIIWLKWDLKLWIYRGLSLKNESALANWKFENTMGNSFFDFSKYWPIRSIFFFWTVLSTFSFEICFRNQFSTSGLNLWLDQLDHRLDWLYQQLYHWSHHWLDRLDH